jgi:hypothetical protein
MAGILSYWYPDVPETAQALKHFSDIGVAYGQFFADAPQKNAGHTGWRKPEEALWDWDLLAPVRISPGLAAPVSMLEFRGYASTTGTH